jgi:hypothetical protein
MTKAEQARVTAWRLKILRWSQNEPRQVARTCRHFGISRTAFYRWKRRFDAHGEAGLGDRPRTPRRSPRAIPREVVSKILYLRQQYHFGPGRIAALPQTLSPGEDCLLFRAPDTRQARHESAAGKSEASAALQEVETV